MGKHTLVYGKVKKDETNLESTICASIYNLGSLIRKEDKPLTENHKLQRGEEKKNLVNTLFNVSKLYMVKTHMEQNRYATHDIKTYVGVNQSLDELGIALANTIWWERYSQVVDVMDTDCVIARRTAKILFEHDKGNGNKVVAAISNLIISKEKEHTNGTQ